MLERIAVAAPQTKELHLFTLSTKQLIIFSPQQIIRYYL